jgi:hypothetical protein
LERPPAAKRCSAARAQAASLPITSESTGRSRSHRTTCPKINGVIAAPRASWRHCSA